MIRNTIFLISLMFIAWGISCEGNDPKKINTCDDGEISAADAVWSHGEGDLQNTKRAPGIRQKGCFTGPVDTPKVQWSFELGGPGTDAAPVIGNDGTIYIVGEYPGEPKSGGVRNSGLMAISPSGTLKWFFPQKIDIGTSSAAIYAESAALGSNDIIYVSLYDSTTYALNLDGQVIWSRPQIRNTSQSPAIDGNQNIYVASDTLYSLYPNGDIRWKFVDTTINGICRKIVLGKNIILYGFLQKGILALDYNGHKKWFYPVNFDNLFHYGILIDEADNLYFKTNSNEILSIDCNGYFRWGGSVGEIGGLSEPVLRGDYLYFGSFMQVYRLNKSTGSDLTLLGSAPFGSYISSYMSPVIDDNGVVFIGSGAGGITAVSNEGNKLWTMLIPNANFEFEGYMAMAPDGTLYLASWESTTPGVINRLYALR